MILRMILEEQLPTLFIPIRILFTSESLKKGNRYFAFCTHTHAVHAHEILLALLQRNPLILLFLLVPRLGAIRLKMSLIFILLFRRRASGLNSVLTLADGGHSIGLMLMAFIVECALRLLLCMCVCV